MKELFKELEKVNIEIERTKEIIKDIYKLAYNLYAEIEKTKNETKN